jgi:hypothetical protein
MSHANWGQDGKVSPILGRTIATSGISKKLVCRESAGKWFTYSDGADAQI